jgi:hypothetical protein
MSNALNSSVIDPNLETVSVDTQQTTLTTGQQSVGVVAVRKPPDTSLLADPMDFEF